MFLGFTNFYRRFIQNFSKIAALLTSILQITDNEALNTQATENKKYQDRRRKNRGYKELARASISQRHLGVFRFHKFL